MRPLIFCYCLLLVSCFCLCEANKDCRHVRQLSHFSITHVWLCDSAAGSKWWRADGKKLFYLLWIKRFFAIDCDLILSSLDNIIVVKSLCVRSGVMDRFWHNYKERRLKRMISRSPMITCVHHVWCMGMGTFCVGGVLPYVCSLSGWSCTVPHRQHCSPHKGRNLRGSASGCWFSAPRSRYLKGHTHTRQHRLTHVLYVCCSYKGLTWRYIT